MGTPAYLKLGGRVEEELVPQEGRAGSQHNLMSFECLVVAGHDGDVTEVLAGPQCIHVLQGRVAVARQSETQHLHLDCREAGKNSLQITDRKCKMVGQIRVGLT